MELGGTLRVIRFLADTSHSYLASLPQDLCDKYHLEQKVGLRHVQIADGSFIKPNRTKKSFELLIKSADKSEEFSATFPLDCVEGSSEPILGIIGMEVFGRFQNFISYLILKLNIVFGHWKIEGMQVYLRQLVKFTKSKKLEIQKTKEGLDYIIYQYRDDL